MGEKEKVGKEDAKEEAEERKMKRYRRTQRKRWEGREEEEEEKGMREFQVVQGEVLSSSSCDYLVQVFRGEGCFGKVAQCLKMDTAKAVAVKVLRKGADALQDFNREAMLETVSILDADKCHLVQWHECFLHRGHPCLVFEMLDKSFQAFMEERNQPLSLTEIRPVLMQLAQAFAALKSIGLIHADLKPDNIMLVNCVDQPFRVKLIDFGLAIPASTARPGDIFHALWYRAPEVLLGLPATEAIDMWALGCIMAYMFQGQHLYISNNEYDAIRFIVEAQGLPENHLLDAGLCTNWYFRRDIDVWRLKTPEEFTRETGIESIESGSHMFDVRSSLSELLRLYPTGAVESQDVCAFIGLMEWLMEVDAEERAMPGDALEHPFLTMSNLEDSYATSSYVQASFLAMKAFSHGSTSATTESVPNVPVDKTSTTSVPVDTTSTNTVPVDKASTSSVPVDTTSTNTVPVDKASTSSVPVDTTSTNAVPVDKASTSSVPVDTTSTNTVPVDKASTSSDRASTPSVPAAEASTAIPTEVKKK
ncbi:homeodomain-interacting protein kinase 1-like, partial [Centroberyx affinis]|uniref:homeodomain-interacting protein kinase 1-like n=1 Tax=Centroberyx affinis TaxID=166261 RepID=UPI003A5BFFB7